MLVHVRLREARCEDCRPQFVCLEADNATVGVLKEKLSNRYCNLPVGEIQVLSRSQDLLSDEDHLHKDRNLFFAFKNGVRLSFAEVTGQERPFTMLFPGTFSAKDVKSILSKVVFHCEESRLRFDGIDDNHMARDLVESCIQVKCESRCVIPHFCEFGRWDVKFDVKSRIWNYENFRKIVSESFAWDPGLVVLWKTEGSDGRKIELFSPTKHVRFMTSSGYFDRLIRLETPWKVADFLAWASDELGLPSRDMVRVRLGNEVIVATDMRRIGTSEEKRLIIEQLTQYHFEVDGVKTVQWLSPKDTVWYACQAFGRGDVKYFPFDDINMKSAIGEVLHGEDVLRIGGCRRIEMTALANNEKIKKFWITDTVSQIQEWGHEQLLRDVSPQNIVVCGYYKIYESSCEIKDVSPWVILFEKGSKISCSVDIPGRGPMNFEVHPYETRSDLAQVVSRETGHEYDVIAVDRDEPSMRKRNMDQRLIIAWDCGRKLSVAERFCVCSFDFVHEDAKTTFKIRFNHHKTLANVKGIVNSLFLLREEDCEWTYRDMSWKKLSDSQTLHDIRWDCRDYDVPAFQVKCKRNPILVLPIKEGSMQIPIELPLSAKVKDLSAKLRERKNRPQAKFQFTRGTETLFTDENASLNETILSDEPIDVKQVTPGTSEEVIVHPTPVASLTSSTYKKLRVTSIVVQSPKNDGPDHVNPSIMSSSGGQTIHCCILNDDEIVCECDVPKTSTIDSLFGLLDAKWQTGYQLCNDEGEPFPTQSVLSSISEQSHVIDFYLKKCSPGSEKRSSGVGSASKPPVKAGDSRGSGDAHASKGSKPLSEWVVDIGELSKDERCLPSRGSGDVQVFKQKDGKLIVGKFLYRNEDGDDQIIFQREVQCLFGLDHPCIVKFAGYTLPCPLTKNRFLIFTEYVTGGSLSSVIEKSSDFSWFDSTVRTIIVVGIVSAMKHIHAQSLVHRDLKPGNILLDEEHHPILCDFGSSRLLFDDATLTNLRTREMYYYMAPEICSGSEDYDNKIDVYSFGIMLYEIITGKLALRHLNMIQVARYINEGKRPQIPNTVLPFTRELIESCWSQEPSERPSFESIYRDIEAHNFRLFSDVDVRRVTEYAKSLPK